MNFFFIIRVFIQLLSISSDQTLTRAIQNRHEKIAHATRLCREKTAHEIRLSTNIALFLAPNSDADFNGLFFKIKLPFFKSYIHFINMYNIL